MDKKVDNLTNLLQRIKQGEEEVKVLEDNLKKESKGKIRRFFSHDDYAEQKLKLYRKKIKSKKDCIKKDKNYADKLCTFDFEMVKRFISSVLSIIEGEKYEAQEINLKSSLSSPYDKLMFPLIATDENRFCIITTAEEIKEVSTLCDSGLISDKDDFKYMIKDGKYILIEIVGYELSLFDYNTKQVPENLIEAHPYLSNVIYDLINYRLANPNLSQDKLIEAVLSQIPEMYSELIEKNKGKKR